MERYRIHPESAVYFVAATMYSALGVDSAAHYIDQLGRPIPITIDRPIERLY